MRGQYLGSDNGGETVTDSAWKDLRLQFFSNKKFSSVHDGCYVIVFYAILLDIETSSMLCFWRNCYIWLAALKMMTNLIKPGSFSRTQITWGFKWLSTWARCPTTPLHCETWTQGSARQKMAQERAVWCTKFSSCGTYTVSHFGQSKVRDPAQE